MWSQGERDDDLPVEQEAVRGLLLTQPAGSRVWQTFAWCVYVLLVFVPLPGLLCQRTTAR